MSVASRYRLLLWPSLITIFNNENTQSPRMHAMIPLDKSLTCIKTTCKFTPEVRGQPSCLLLPCLQYCGSCCHGYDSNLKQTNTNTPVLPVPTCHIEMISMLNIAKLCWQFLSSPFPLINLHIMNNVNLSLKIPILLDKESSVTVKNAFMFP